MSETETRTQQQTMRGKRLAVAELQAVKWVASQAAVKRAYDGLKPRYQTLRRTAILGWFLVMYETIFCDIMVFMLLRYRNHPHNYAHDTTMSRGHWSREPRVASDALGTVKTS
ncbi:hypothetical protein E2C01_014601 [Portunus trituberculatus]|uniref:Uncharacterized protein n=1 Tax=Portunus trituberculatus TaxID=210409 RepID=A0A5B7DJA8_PORTR|nr:hypothetical protein [Portunus trituberculatus]